MKATGITAHTKAECLLHASRIGGKRLKSNSHMQRGKDKDTRVTKVTGEVVCGCKRSWILHCHSSTGAVCSKGLPVRYSRKIPVGSQLGSSSCHPLTKQLDVHLLQGMGTAELIQLVVDFVEDQGLVVVCRVIPHDVIHWGRDRITTGHH